MNSKRTISLVIVYLFLIAAVTLSVRLLSARTRPVGTASFKGWTNIAGKLHAIVEFPPASMKEPDKNWFITWFYRVQLDISYTLPNGAVTNESPWLPVYNGPGRLTTVHVELPRNITNFRITRAATSIERRWDNISLPFDPPGRYYSFVPPEIDPSQTR